MRGKLEEDMTLYPASLRRKIPTLSLGLFLVPIAFAFDSRAITIILILLGISLALRALAYSFKKRVCHHGFITSDATGFFFFPFVVDPCPKCGVRSIKDT